MSDRFPFAGALALALTICMGSCAGLLHVDKFGTGPRAMILLSAPNCDASLAGTVARYASDYTVYAVSLCVRSSALSYGNRGQRRIGAEPDSLGTKRLDDARVDLPS